MKVLFKFVKSINNGLF